MGEVIYLSDRLADRTRASVGPAAFFYSFDCPLSYLMAERVERALGDVAWIPVVGPLSESSELMPVEKRLSFAYERLAAADREAHVLSLPLVEPQRYPMDAAGLHALPSGRAATAGAPLTRWPSRAWPSAGALTSPLTM
ncbi:MAG TPA: hypothetical protein VME01_00210 [Solirubrobacteraceae bacterium]|nr:hypothetical protein [Solirubrobacteraceae bacterium]